MATLYMVVCHTGQQLFEQLGYLEKMPDATIIHVDRYERGAAGIHRDGDKTVDEQFNWTTASGKDKPAVVVWKRG